MEKLNCEDIGYPVGRYDVVEPIELDIKCPIKMAISHLLKCGDMPGDKVYDIVMTLMLIHLDLLGYLYSASSTESANNAVKFIRKYFGKVDNRYAEVGGLLYYALRHGWVHKSVPKILGLDSNTTIGFIFSDTINRNKHLRVLVNQSEVRRVVSVVLFFDDMMAAIDKYCEDYRANRNLRDTYKTALEKLGKPEQLTRANGKYIRHYILDSDLQFLRK